MEKKVEELFKALKEKTELREKLRDLWKNGVAEKISALIESAGITTDVETVEKVLALYQNRVKDRLQEMKLDDKQLEAVTGGGNGLCKGAADCDKYFESIPDFPLEDRCEFAFYCDEWFL